MEREEKEERQQHAGRMIHTLSCQLKRRSFMPGGDCGLTPTQKHVLKFILMESMHRDLYQRDVEEEFQVRRSTATGMLQLMEKNGFIFRESVEQDARLKKIVPTEKAVALRAEILENIMDMEQKLRFGISDSDFELCMRVMQKMLANLTGQEDGTGEAGNEKIRNKEVCAKADEQKTI